MFKTSSVGAVFALALLSTSAFAAAGGGAGGTTAPNTSASPTNAQTPRPATTATRPNTTQQQAHVDPAPGNGGAHTYHIVRPGSTKSHTTSSPKTSSNPGN